MGCNTNAALFGVTRLTGSAARWGAAVLVLLVMVLGGCAPASQSEIASYGLAMSISSRTETGPGGGLLVVHEPDADALGAGAYEPAPILLGSRGIELIDESEPTEPASRLRINIVSDAKACIGSYTLDLKKHLVRDNGARCQGIEASALATSPADSASDGANDAAASGSDGGLPNALGPGDGSGTQNAPRRPAGVEDPSGTESDSAEAAAALAEVQKATLRVVEDALDTPTRGLTIVHSYLDRLAELPPQTREVYNSQTDAHMPIAEARQLLEEDAARFAPFAALLSQLRKVGKFTVQGG